MKSFWGNFYRHLAIFSGHTVPPPPLKKTNFMSSDPDGRGLCMSLILSCHKQDDKHFNIFWGRGGGSVGGVVTSNTWDPMFESSHRQFVFTINSFKSVLKRQKWAQEWPIKNIIIYFESWWWLNGQRARHQLVHSKFKSFGIYCFCSVKLFEKSEYKKRGQG